MSARRSPQNRSRSGILPTRPTKLTDSRAKKWTGGDGVELGAIPARQLRELVRKCIERHVDKRKLETLKVAEASEREMLIRGARPRPGAAPLMDEIDPDEIERLCVESDRAPDELEAGR